MYDAIVVGARCAGSPTAMLLARKGYKVLMVDRTTFPSDMAFSNHFMHQAGLRDVQYRTALLGVRSTDPMVDYLPSTVESLRGTILKLGLLGESDLDTALADCRAHLAKPGTSFSMYTVAQVWGHMVNTILLQGFRIHRPFHQILRSQHTQFDKATRLSLFSYGLSNV